VLFLSCVRVSVSGVLFSVGVCVCDLLTCLHLSVYTSQALLSLFTGPPAPAGARAPPAPAKGARRHPDAAAPVARLPHTQGVMYIMYPYIYLSIYRSMYLSISIHIYLSI